MEEFAGGLVALTGDEEGAMAQAALARKDPAGPLQKLLAVFGRENVFVEIQRHRFRGGDRIVPALTDAARRCGAPLLATNGVLHSLEEERTLLDVFTCIRNHTHLDAAGRLLAPNAERHLKKRPRKWPSFSPTSPEAVNNTMDLADRLDFTLENLGYDFPEFPSRPATAGFLPARTSLRRRPPACSEVPPKVRQQLETELALIARLKISGYFLIVWDIVQFCRRENIMAQGRGSAANSTVCFCLGITAVGPLKFHTLFKRFLTGPQTFLAGHRHRSPQRRPPRARHSGGLSPLRPARRRHDRERHHLSRAQRRAPRTTRP